MNLHLPSRAPSALQTLSPRDAGVLLAQALSLRQAARDGRSQPLLKGKRLGLLCDSLDGEEAALFQRAAGELGAHVAHVRPSLTDTSTPTEVAHTARLLGRLYDGVECQGMSPALVRRVGEEAGVPVFDGLATARHPLAGLAQQLDGADDRRFLLQALLLSSLA